MKIGTTLSRKRKKDPGTVLHHAVANANKALCGATVAAVLDEDWPPHWPRIDRRAHCRDCADRATRRKHRPPHGPNIRMTNAAADLRRLATPITEAVNQLREELSLLGWPGRSSDGGGATSDSDPTLAAATRAGQLEHELDEMQTQIEQAERAIERLDIQCRRILPTGIKPKPPVCGQTQQAMSNNELTGWDNDPHCSLYGIDSHGLCKRHAQRFRRRKRPDNEAA